MARTTLTLTLLALALVPALGARPALTPDVNLAGLGEDAPGWLAQLTERNDD